MPLTLVGGEALYDLWIDGDGALHGRPGGGPFTTARTVARLGQPVAFLGRLSRDRAGAALARMLAEDGVRLEATVRTDAPTTLALADIGAGGDAHYSFYERGTAAPGLRPADALARLPDAVGILHVGSLGLALEPIGTALEAVVERLAGRALVVLDPNVRPWVIAHPAAYRHRLERMLVHADLVKVSEEDLAWLAPGVEPVAAARGLLTGRGRVALLTRGAAGATVVTGAEAVDVPAAPARVVDTIGAGDAFAGGILAFWAREDLDRAALGDLDRVVAAARFAALVAARTCERPGALPPRLAELGV
jgi:fructokinase